MVKGICAEATIESLDKIVDSIIIIIKIIQIINTIVIVIVCVRFFEKESVHRVECQGGWIGYLSVECCGVVVEWVLICCGLELAHHGWEILIPTLD